MAYLKKITLPSESGTVEEIKIGRLEKKILERAALSELHTVRVWKIAEGMARSQYYRDVIYQTVINLKRKGLIKIENNGQRGGLTISLTERGKQTLKALSDAIFPKMLINFTKSCVNYGMC
jgi:hypothetical protein